MGPFDEGTIEKIEKGKKGMAALKKSGCHALWCFCKFFKVRMNCLTVPKAF